MVRLRQALSLPMFATAIGLTWIIGRQGGINSMALGASAAMLLALALWWYGMRQFTDKRMWPTALPLMAAIALVIFAIPGATQASKSADEASDDIAVFSAQKLGKLQSEGKPVFLYMTADWCLSCKVNEATSLSSPEVKDAFAKAGATVMRGDWTNGDPAITAFLKQNGKFRHTNLEYTSAGRSNSSQWSNTGDNFKLATFNTTVLCKIWAEIRYRVV